ncbi:MAG: hypothetical protein ACNS62_23635 [Candidatus Cyclobacteriaceae bacterium M3_2C_046]
MEKKRIIKSYEKLSSELQDKLRDQYPYGFSNKLIRLNNSKNETFFAVPLETDDTTYMVKVQIEKIKRHDDADDEFHFSVGDEEFDSTSESSPDVFDDSNDPSYNPNYDESDD